MSTGIFDSYDRVPRVPGVPDLPDGCLLEEVEKFLRRFCILPGDHAYVATTLWVAHTHCLDAFDSTPRLAALSPEPGSGKTRLLEIIELLVPRPLFTYNTSAAVLYRSMTPDAEGNIDRPVILLDEADTVFGPRASKDHEELRGFVNAGYKAGATAHRVGFRGKQMFVEEFPSFAAVALAGLDDLPDTIMTRSVVLRMRRRAPHEQVEPYRRRLNADEGHQLAERLAEWTGNHSDELGDPWPELPPSIVDRHADIWEPLIAIAELAGGDWPQRARDAAVAMVEAAATDNTQSLNLRLLAALRDIYRDEADPFQLSTAFLVRKLTEREDEPWSDIRGKALDGQGLAQRLRKYGIAPEKYREGGETHRGYRRADLADAWARYLPTPSGNPEQVEQVEQVTLTTLPTPTPTEQPHGCAGDDCRYPGCSEGVA